MKEKINYEYHIQVDNLIKKEHYYYFEKDNKYFYLTEIRRSEEEFRELINLYEELKQRNYPVHTIVKTYNGNFVINDEGKNYLLTIVDKPQEEYNLFDMLKIWDQMPLIKKNSILNRPNWALLWQEKIDYFEYQVRELGRNKELVLNTFSYFIGLTENSISYINRINKYIKPVNYKLVLCHKRVWYPNIHLNYDNPLQFIFDLEIRDVCEYIKGIMLEDEELALIELKSYLNTRRLDQYTLGLLYGRLIYPSYYFDLYENIMNFNANEECLIKIVDKIDVIEDFLKKAYELIYHYAPIEPVNWLLKKEVIN